MLSAVFYISRQREIGKGKGIHLRKVAVNLRVFGEDRDPAGLFGAGNLNLYPLGKHIRADDFSLLLPDFNEPLQGNGSPRPVDR